MGIYVSANSKGLMQKHAVLTAEPPRKINVHCNISVLFVNI